MLKSKNGFSLVELMIVVGIIAILASFANVQYKAFQIRSRQKESTILLAAYYTTVKSFEAEGYPGNFVALGFNPAGQLHYRVSVQDGTSPSTGPNNDSCVNTVNNCGGFGKWSEVTSGIFASGAPVSCTPATGASGGTFTACASAVLRLNAGCDVDTWAINEVKIISHTNDGSM